MKQARLRHAEIARALAAEGFKYARTDAAGWLVFKGALRAGTSTHEIQIRVDPSGLELPTVQLSEIPPQLRPVAPHISPDGTLCYAARGTIVPDVFDPAAQAVACIARATDVLDRVLRGELVADLEEEFFAFWSGPPCLLDLAGGGANADAFILSTKRGAIGAVVVTDDRARTQSKLAAYRAIPSGTAPTRVLQMSTDVAPRPMQGKWPPANVSDVLTWQGALDRSAHRKLERRLTKTFSGGWNKVICLIRAPKISYSFAVAFESVRRSKKGWRRSPLARKRTMLNSPVFPLVSVRVDDSYVAGRSTPGRRTLTGKKVVLVGCGTIGGFLAELLMKAGGGQGKGELVLVDPEVLGLHNIGRHRLGFPSIFRKKADALASELRRSWPGLRITSVPTDVLEVNMKGADLVIDATGEEALSNMLAWKQSDRFFPLLTTWIEGPGSAVRALLREVPDAACYSCVNDPILTPRYPAVRGAVAAQLAGHGCEGLYVPFPVTASVQAACLAAEMTLSWVNGRSTPRLRTRVLDDSLEKGSADVDPERVVGCRACNT